MQTLSTYGSILDILLVFDRIKHEVFIFLRYILMRIYCVLYFYQQGSLHKSITNATQNLTKMPSHISFLIFEDNISMEDLSFVVALCFTMGISFVSVCMKEGFVHEMKESLNYELRRKKEHLKKELNLHIDDVSITTDGFISKSKTSESASKYRIHLLSPTSGRNYVVNCAKHLAATVPHDEITLETVDQYIRESSGLPEPQLAIKFGKIDSLLGFCPWQARTTEIMSYPSLKNFKWRQLVATLHKFTKTEQRWGK